MRTAGQGPLGFKEQEGIMRPGQDLIMAGWAGLKGARLMAEEAADLVGSRFCPAFLEGLGAGKDSPDGEESQVLDWAKEAMGTAITAYSRVGEGGVLAALWNLSGSCRAGISFDLRLIPVRQATVEICELFGLNPYRLLTGGAFVAAADNGAAAVREMAAQGISGAVIGQVIEGDARRVSHGGEEAGFLERPQPDEIERFYIQMGCGSM